MAEVIDNAVQAPPEAIRKLIEESNISESDFSRIQARIESIVTEEVETPPLEKQYRVPRRSGRVFPILLNIIAAAFIVGAVYALSWYFSGREAEVVQESSAYSGGAEAQLIEEILRESEAALAEKDAEIGEIQSRMAQLDNERRALEENLQAEVDAREAELRSQLEAELNAERARLQNAGQSESEIAEQLRSLQATREAEYAADLETYRQETQAELAARQAELDSLQGQLQDTLATSQAERQRLVQEAADREARVREELGAEIEALAEAEQAAQAQLQALRDRQEADALLTDQILGSFTIVVQDIQDGMTNDALNGLSSLERLLRDAAGGTTTQEQRRRTELSLVGTLRSLVQEVDVLRQNLAVRDLTTTTTQQAAVEQQRAADLIETASEVIALAETARANGRYAEARTLYQQALATIPSLETVYPGILELESARRQAVIETAIGEATTLLGTGGAESAVATYLQALRDLAADENDPLLTMADGIGTAVDRAEDDLLELQAGLEQEYRGTITSRDNQIADLNRQIVAARNQVTNSQTTIAQLQREAEDLNDEIDQLTATLEQRNADLAAARQASSTGDDAIAGLQTSLAAEQARTSSLQTSLAAEQTRVATLQSSLSEAEAELDELEATNLQLQTERTTLTAARETLTAQVATLEDQLDAALARAETAEATAEQSEREAEQQTDEATVSAQAHAAAQAQIDSLTRQITDLESRASGLNDQIAGLNTQVEDLNTQIAEAQTERDDALAEVTSLQASSTQLQAELDAANATATSLQEQLASLRQARAQGDTDVAVLEQEIASLESDVADLRESQRAVDTLVDRYETQLARAQQNLVRGNFELARTTLLSPFASGTGATYFPALESTLQDIVRGLIGEARSETSGEARTDALDDVVTLARAIQQNTDEPRESATVRSLLTRNDDLEDVANAMFEIVELSSRATSAPEVQYQLLGSVSRVEANRLVVERLVDLDVNVGDTVEMRRSPELGQEVPIAQGTVLQVTDRRVVVSIVELYRIDLPPSTQDLVYVETE